ncbi:hypothetical protein MASR1M107_00800 [Ignavibacteriales bacterium]
MEKLKKKLEKLKFRLLLLPADNHSDVPVTVIGFRKGVLYLIGSFAVMAIISFFLFRFTPMNSLVNVHPELSDEDKALISNLNKKVVGLLHDLNKIKSENDRMKFFLTLQDSTVSSKNDSIVKSTKDKAAGEKATPKTLKDKKGNKK